MTTLPLRIALRYLFSRKSYHVINMISGIGAAGMAIGTAALVVILSVFNGFDSLVSQSLTDAHPDLVIKPATGKVFRLAEIARYCRPHRSSGKRVEFLYDESERNRNRSVTD